YTTFNVPAKYLGSDVSNMLAKLDDTETKNLTVPVTATIGGNYSNPNISTNLTTAVTSLTKQLVEKQKGKLIDKGKDEVKDRLSDIINRNTKSGDSTTVKKDSAKASQQEAVKDAAQDFIKNVFG